MANFTVDTHLFRELGELLVGRDSTALIELIKNSYDADATQVTVYGAGIDDSDSGYIAIVDNGVGMTPGEFKNGFLRVASRLKEAQSSAVSNSAALLLHASINPQSIWETKLCAQYSAVSPRRFPENESTDYTEGHRAHLGSLRNLRIVGRSSGRIARMPKPLSAEDIFPLVDSLSLQERLRLLRLISIRPAADDPDAYRALPPRGGEFSSDDEPLAWDAEGWEDIG